MKKILILLTLVISLFASVESKVDEVRFERSGGVLTDTFSEMQWQDNSDAKSIKKDWQGAMNYCANLTLYGKNDWRLPNRDELKYAYKIKYKFNNLTSRSYWSSSTNVSFPRTAWYMSFEYGNLYYKGKTRFSYYVRCVRGGQYDTLGILEKKIQKNKKATIGKSVTPFYQKVKKLNTIKAYKNFTKKYPQAPQINEVIENIYNLINDKENIAGYEWFIKTYPKAPQVKEAIQMIHKLAYEEAEDIDEISSYNTFIIAYPTASQVADANENALDLEYYKYTDTLPSWFRAIMPDFMASIFNSIIGIFSSDEKKSRALLIKAKQIERQGNNYYGNAKAGYVIITNRMYELLQDEYTDTDATLRHLESPEFKDFVRTFKSVMSSISSKLGNIEKYSSEILSTSKKGFEDAKADRDMAEYKRDQHTKWEKQMHFRDKGYQ